ncbi:GNAT family N-acetyltransferase [Glutamicibacter mishrai]|uniref:GNAT family N-acetyltransferase n=1 Tax=Glutamicibacter mishrai TaxID=1775880 RepID=UPI0020CF9E68|nr:GNAT family N-acetyltransferase [Glutamicibacter mishrai]UTT39881.1 GNAT family N-acetyltransferase [Glutamicibacter mishrai]
MLADTPIAFSETMEQAKQVTEAEWRDRAKRGTAHNGTALVAIASTGQWLGTMGAYIPKEGDDPRLVGVYVTPEYRGEKSGITERLLEEIIQWASNYSQKLLLNVHERNARARRFYRKQGFVETGKIIPFNLDPQANEIEMIYIID